MRPARVLALREGGLTLREVADQTSVSVMTVQRLLKRGVVGDAMTESATTCVDEKRGFLWPHLELHIAE